MILYCKTQPDKQSFVFQQIEGRNWRTEVQNALPSKSEVIKEFYEKRAKLTLGVPSLDEVIKDPTILDLKTQKELEGTTAEYEVSELKPGSDPREKNTLSKILKDYFQNVVKVGDETQAGKEAYLSLHILAQNGVNVDFIRADEYVEITDGKMSIYRRTAGGNKYRLLDMPIRELKKQTAAPAAAISPGRPKPPARMPAGEPALTPPIAPVSSPIEQRQGSTEKRKGSLDPD